MEQMRFLHCACLYHKILTNKVPPYLLERINYRCDVHNANTRSKNSLVVPTHFKENYKRSFSYQIVEVYNKINIDVKKLNPKKMSLAQALSNNGN